MSDPNSAIPLIRRKIVGTDGDVVWPETQTMDDYSRDELVDAIRSVMRKGCNYDRQEVIEAVARHLGFSRVRETIAAPVKSAINAAIRRGVLGYDGKLIWREA
ncbi:MAG TPA: hypothetical protein VM243_02940 [Phycisphaerae bacterium]|nr:hypothetical protein [Phycisphaerae bacterium]